jgi:hypothetical protein
MIRLRSVASPFSSRELFHHAVSAMMRAEAMGLLPREEVFATVDRETMTRVLDHIFQAGIARGLAAAVAEPAHLDADRLDKLLAASPRGLEPDRPRAFQRAGPGPLAGGGRRDVIVFRHGDRRFPFLWESRDQPGGRWHGDGDGPVQYLADTPDGAWAEFLRHEDITDAEDFATIRRALWVVDLPEPPAPTPALAVEILTGGAESYPPCREEARRLRATGATGLVAPSAALLRGGAHGLRVDGGLQQAEPRDGRVIVLFGPRPDLVGWPAAVEGRPDEDLLPRVRHFASARGGQSRGGTTG